VARSHSKPDNNGYKSAATTLLIRVVAVFFSDREYQYDQTAQGLRFPLNSRLNKATLTSINTAVNGAVMLVRSAELPVFPMTAFPPVAGLLLADVTALSAGLFSVRLCSAGGLVVYFPVTGSTYIM